MKVLISQPMKGLTEEQIRENRSSAVKKLEQAGHEVLDSIFSDFGKPKEDIKNIPLYFLARSLALIAEEADAVLFLPGWEEARGCKMEHSACEAYGVTALYS